MPHPSVLMFLAAVATAVLPATVSAQNPAFEVSDHVVEILDAADAMDDIVLLPDGSLVASRPNLQAVGIQTPSGFTPLNASPVIALALAVAPDGALWVGDAAQGTVRRIDPATGQDLVVSAGFNIPIDLVFGEDGALYVVDLTNGDFNFGPNDVWRVEISGALEVSRTLLFAGLPGATDIAFPGNGRAYAASLGSIDLLEIDLATGVGSVTLSGILLPSDLEPLPGERLLVPTLYEARLYEVDLLAGTALLVEDRLGGQPFGAEDVAITSEGDALVSVQSGQVYRIDLTSPLRQATEARLGQWVPLRLERPDRVGWNYVLGLAASADFGLVIPGGPTVPLDPDILFELTLDPRPAELQGFDGVLDAEGRGLAELQIPAIPDLAGVVLYCAGVLLPSPGAAPGSWEATNAVRLVLQP